MKRAIARFFDHPIVVYVAFTAAFVTIMLVTVIPV